MKKIHRILKKIESNYSEGQIIDLHEIEFKLAEQTAIEFTKWIGERMNKDSWFKYDARFGTWYWHTKGHLTTDQLFEEWNNLNN